MDTVSPKKALRLSGIALVVIAVSFAVIDGIYRITQGISFATRQKCILYQSIPRFAFLIFENIVELGLSVYLGVFLATLIEQYMLKIKPFIPRNPFAAFLYGSILPVCSCSAIPLIKTMRSSVSMRTIITFVMAAPLLNPYTIFISYTVLGPFYGTARIIGAFILSVSAGYGIELLAKKSELLDPESYKNCGGASCGISERDVFVKTMRLFLSILPYLAIGAALSIVGELLLPNKVQALTNLVNTTFFGNLLVIIMGVPLYLCNGADVFILRPLINDMGLSMGVAIEFSLTSTAICMTSIFMLIKFLGKRLTFALISHIVIVTLIIGYCVNLVGRLLHV